MFYKCLECGHIFEEGEQKTWKEPHGEILCGCPCCDGGFKETHSCIICGSQNFLEDMTSGVCEECFEKYYNDQETCYRFGIDGRQELSINGFLASLFSVEQIEQMLFEKVKMMEFVDCKPFINEDKYWFAEKLEKEFKNERK